MHSKCCSIAVDVHVSRSAAWLKQFRFYCVCKLKGAWFIFSQRAIVSRGDKINQAPILYPKF